MFSTMKHLLDPHEAIAWDIDGTLIDGPNAGALRRWIAANPHRKHHLVTFRSFDWAITAFDELEWLGLPRGILLSVQACPEELFDAYEQQGSLIKPDAVAAFIRWKGKTAAALGCTVLVDDMPTLVQQGCTDHGIEFIHSHDPRLSDGDPEYW